MKRTLLIAEGDTELCNLYRHLLMERGYTVETSNDGLDCLRKLRRGIPDVLVLDLDLHWGGGEGVLAWLREESPTHGIPVRFDGQVRVAAGVRQVHPASGRGMSPQALCSRRVTGKCRLRPRGTRTQGIREPAWRRCLLGT